MVVLHLSVRDNWSISRPSDRFSVFVCDKLPEDSPVPTMLALLPIVATALLPSPTVPLQALSARRAIAPVMQNWELEEERKESIKASAICSVSGSVASFPVKLSAMLASGAFSKAATVAQYQYCAVALAVQLALFGVVYRCAVRSDNNDAVKQGAVAGFAVFRALSCTPASNMWGPDMWTQLAVYFGESLLAFGVAASALEWAWDMGWAFPLPGIGLPLIDFDGAYNMRGPQGRVMPTGRFRGMGGPGRMGPPPPNFRGGQRVPPSFRPQGRPIGGDFYGRDPEIR